MLVPIATETLPTRRPGVAVMIVEIGVTEKHEAQEAHPMVAHFMNKLAKFIGTLPLRPRGLIGEANLPSKVLKFVFHNGVS